MPPTSAGAPFFYLLAGVFILIAAIGGWLVFAG